MRDKSVRHTAQSLAAQLHALGVARGAVLFLRGDVGKIGRTEGPPRDILMRALREAVGEEGTLVALAFTRIFFLPRLDRDYVFDRDTPPTTGALATLLLEQPDAVRSEHPTDSFVAIGKHAKRILAGHDETAAAFLPMERLIELDASMVVFGCVDSSPGFTTVHWVQHALGLSTRSLLRNRFGVLYRRDGEVRLFRRRDTGGCSMGFHKFYAEYARHGKMSTGRFGNAYAIQARARDASAIERALLERDPKFALCDDPACATCRGSWTYNLGDMIPYYARHLPSVLLRLFGPGSSRPRRGSLHDASPGEYRDPGRKA